MAAANKSFAAKFETVSEQAHFVLAPAELAPQRCAVLELRRYCCSTSFTTGQDRRRRRDPSTTCAG